MRRWTSLTFSQIKDHINVSSKKTQK